MKINKKKELFACLDSLFQINEQLNFISLEERQELLPLCQQMAMEMGTLIEKAEGEGTVAVSLLEKYCEEIYQIYMGQLKLDLTESCETIQKLLDSIRKSIENIQPSPYEILFLPYKAAMWDSLESIYLAAAEQPECHVTVMPIPYYNVNPQKEILSVEYEGNLFPENIPITDFRDYDLKSMEPDAIFIHNPYDQYNYVTQVADDYFSTELIKYTSRLIYIPYFVTSHNTIASHYCLVPGVKNAWRTFVQSEGVKEGYQQYVFDKEKIVALGSPKFDKVKKVEENLSRVPEEWKKVFNGKKVFLLNTHLNYIINKSELMLDKLFLIFNYFHQNKDIVLLWRPHPLSIETAKSLSPGFLIQYLELIEEFKLLSIGIYDDSADIHRAIAVSHAYIGNVSSVVPLYGVTGKPIYLFGSTINNVIEQERDYLEKEKLQITEKKIVAAMNSIEDRYKYLYDEVVTSLEYYVEAVKNERDLCKAERVSRFMKLQYGYMDEQSAGERIWNYVYKDIIDQRYVE